MTLIIRANVNSALKNKFSLKNNRRDQWHLTMQLTQEPVKKFTWRLMLTPIRIKLQSVRSIPFRRLRSPNQSWHNLHRSSPMCSCRTVASLLVQLISICRASKLHLWRTFKRLRIQIKSVERKSPTKATRSKWSSSTSIECKFLATIQTCSRTTAATHRSNTILWSKTSSSRCSQQSMGTVTSLVQSSRKWTRVSFHLLN